MSESWQEMLTQFNNADKTKAGGYRRQLQTNESSIDDIREQTNSVEKNDDVESQNDLIYAVEILDTIICAMIVYKTKSIRYEVNERSKCRRLLVSLAIKRGLNAELCKKDTRYVIIDCY